MTFSAVSVAQQAEAFVEALRRANKSPRTIDCYGDDLAKFIPWIERVAIRHPGLAPDKTLALAAHDYLNDLQDRGNAPASLKRRLACLRSFGKFLTDEGTLPFNPFSKITGPVEGLQLLVG